VTPEKWLPVPGWEGHYEVSSQGRVRSLHHPNGSRRIRLVQARPTGPGGRYLGLMLSRPGLRLQVKVHKLVLLAFHGPRPSPNHVGAHGNGNAFDNCEENLRWATYEENEADKQRHGTTCQGERHHAAKLTAETVREIRRLHSAGRSRAALAARYGVTSTAIGYIVQRRNWKHVA
jgi:hypothetical protein